MRGWCALALSIVAACGDNGGRGAVDATPGPDASAVVDAAPCTTFAWIVPERVSIHSWKVPERHLALDGQGRVCDQIVRAVADPALTPPELVPFLANQSVTVSCVGDPDVWWVEVRGTGVWYGHPIHGLLPDQVVFLNVVGAGDRVVRIEGSYLVAELPPAPCLDRDQTISAMLGERLSYVSRTETCGRIDDAEYPIATDDEIAITEPQLYYDTLFGRLNWIRRLDVVLLPSHVRPDMRRSALDCCAGGEPLHCVGAELYAEMTSGSVVVQQPRCDLECP